MQTDEKHPDQEALLDEKCINTIRFLAVDMVQKAKSGHPGTPMGAATMAYQKDGALPRLAPTFQVDGITVYANGAAKSLAEALNSFLAQSRPGDYVALQSYVQPTEQTSATLQQLRTGLRDRLRLATTVGYGPRFLHSTGQLHKGDAGNGLFIQCTDDTPQDVPIPDEAGSPTSSITFGVLKMAQALGDRQALLDARPRRRVITFHLDKDVAGGLEKLMEALA